jgi:hypothetical protein
MGTLNPDIPSEELTRALSEAVTIMRGMRQRVLIPEHLLLAFLDNKAYAAHGLLAHFADERGFKLDDLTHAVEDQARTRRSADVDFDFEAQDGSRVPLGNEMLVVLDEGRAIARARDEIWVGTEDALAAMSQSGVSTAGLLQQRGITPRSLSTLLADSALARQTTVRDLVALARDGQLQPVYYRQELLRDLLNLLSLARDRGGGQAFAGSQPGPAHRRGTWAPGHQVSGRDRRAGPTGRCLSRGASRAAQSRGWDSLSSQHPSFLRWRSPRRVSQGPGRCAARLSRRAGGRGGHDQ